MALGLAVVLFFVVPVTITSAVQEPLGSAVLFSLIDLISDAAVPRVPVGRSPARKDMRRVFSAHGAEHKTISCLEAGMELTPANAQRFSRLHPRCGTSFLLIVMIVAIFAFAPLGLPAWYRLVSRASSGCPDRRGLVRDHPVRRAYRTTPWVRALIWPGLKLQLLTTREPDLAQLEVAIAALNDVLASRTSCTSKPSSWSASRSSPEYPVERTDFVSLSIEEVGRAVGFYRDTLGLGARC